MTGNEFESAVVAEIYKQIKSYNLPVQLWHLSTQDGREVDLLIEIKEGFIPIEIKRTENASQKDARHLNNLSDILNKPILKKLILSRDPEIKTFENNVLALPISYALS